MLRIYGYSDDNVELEGAQAAIMGEQGDAGALRIAHGLTEELRCYDQDVEITIGDPTTGGLVVLMSYGEPGVWAARLRQIEEDCGLPWPVRVSVNAEQGYSMAVEIDAPAGVEASYRKLKREPAEVLRERVEQLEKANAALKKRNASLEPLAKALTRAAREIGET